jgi:hypothetical protein
MWGRAPPQPKETTTGGGGEKVVKEGGKPVVGWGQPVAKPKVESFAALFESEANQATGKRKPK